MSIIEDISLEKYALGCAMENVQALEAFLALSPDELETGRGQELHAAMAQLKGKGSAVNLVTMDHQTDGKHTQYLIGAGTCAPSPSLYGEYIKGLRDKASRRRIAAAAGKLHRDITVAAVDPDEAVGDMMAVLNRESASRTSTVSAAQATMSLLEMLEKKPDGRRAYFGISRLDELLGGVFGGKLVVVGARPTAGKSALALNAAMATQSRGHVLFCSFEMSPEEIIGRALAQLSGVNAQKIAYRDLSREDMAKLGAHCNESYGMDIHITTKANTPSKVRCEAIRLNRDGKLGLIVIDYLQLMSSGRRAESRRVEVGQISRELKALAMELDVPVLALSQLNRLSEGTVSKVPTMAEMRESGDIEQDADVVLLMYLPPENQREPHIREIRDAGMACVRIILEKNRQGQSGFTTETAFDGAGMRFLKVSEVVKHKG